MSACLATSGLAEVRRVGFSLCLWWGQKPLFSKLPKWVEFGAFTLAFVAGSVNVVGLLSFQHQSVSHVTGTVTQLGLGLLGLPSTIPINLIGVLVSFVFGASVAGFLLHGSTLKLGRHYDTVLLLDGTLLAASTLMLLRVSPLGYFLAATACGIQNAMATTYSGAVVRTTHMTGIFTDLGIMIGSRLRGQPFDRRRAVLFLLIVLGFSTGGTFGSLLYSYVQSLSMLFPACVCFSLALIYRFYYKPGTSSLTNLPDLFH